MENYCSNVKKTKYAYLRMEKMYQNLWIIIKETSFVKVSCLFQIQCASFSEWAVKLSANSKWSFMILIQKWYLFQLLYSED